MSNRIVIIGGGFSGAMTAAHLLRDLAEPARITLIETRPTFGRGLAYSTEDESHLLNVPAGKMSAFPDKPDDFLNWLQSRFPAQSFEPSTFVQRRVFGEYVASVLAEAALDRSSLVEYERVNDTAVSALPADDILRVATANGSTFDADILILATGNPAPSLSLPQSLRESRYYIHDIWSERPWRTGRRDDSILIIGSGLTAVDAVLSYREHGFRGKIEMLSRRGLIPNVHRVESSQYKFDPSIAKLPLRQLARKIRNDINGEGNNWRSVIDSLRPHNQKIWKSWSSYERSSFMRHLRPYWEVARHRMAPDISIKISALRSSGDLTITAGRIMSVKDLLGQAEISIRVRGGNDRTIRANAILNCIGAEASIRRTPSPLLASLLRVGSITPGPSEMGIASDENGAAISRASGVSSEVYVIGPLRRGDLWETTAVPEIREQAKSLADRIISGIRSSNAGIAATGG